MELFEVQKEAHSASRKAMVFGAGALLLAGVLGFMIARLQASGTQMQPVVVATMDVAPLTLLQAKHLKSIPWPAAAVPSGGFGQVEDVLKKDPFNTTHLMKGEPIVAARLSSSHGGMGVSQLLEPKMRAYVVQASEGIASSRILYPGACVDVISTLTDPHTRQLVSKVILQNIRVLAVGDRVEIEATPQDSKTNAVGEERAVTERRRVITLSVPLADVEALAFASREGKIDVALRNPYDTDIVATGGFWPEKILGSPPKASSENHPPALPALETKARSIRRTLPARRTPSASPPAGPSIYKVGH